MWQRLSKHCLVYFWTLVHFYYCNTSPIRHQPIGWITPLKYKNVSLIRHHAPSSNAFPFPHIGTVKVWCFPILFVQSPKVNTHLKRRYSLKYWPVCFTYKAPLHDRCLISEVLLYVSTGMLLFKCALISLRACEPWKSKNFKWPDIWKRRRKHVWNK